ncbi:hypothetical protein [Streptomyces europaeiscabiei]|uniref:hypothetical protein n=1 Tax=Streptomyces europaeiscabiei TaxID=146819 RepID=UPI0029A5FAE8|nr:hypothetical protein [Streptomyces europaeiscabiei]MDX2761417.1 hypothetical protein [Streptomyces europaeiscabiei]MDX2771148.1 hypothetical protein [Streptomyces europaeiscabiei]MDX3711108.1 hypothetical protein [Streptomyces europaeiscabiei]MDX3831904.1 hypothetical protein [Streptomyces europaeiscabiei]MDX3840246.1 hypothetical protein [Streptomyces europaeiscabiei]
MSEHAYGPGEGPTKSVSVSVHEGTIAAVRTRVGKRGVSAYVEAAVQRQIERDQLDELIAANEELHGPLSQEEIDAAEREMFGDSQDDRAVA